MGWWVSKKVEISTHRILHKLANLAFLSSISGVHIYQNSCSQGNKHHICFSGHLCSVRHPGGRPLAFCLGKKCQENKGSNQINKSILHCGSLNLFTKRHPPNYWNYSGNKKNLKYCMPRVPTTQWKFRGNKRFCRWNAYFLSPLEFRGLIWQTFLEYVCNALQ